MKTKDLANSTPLFHTHTPKGYVWNKKLVESEGNSHHHIWGAWTTQYDEGEGVYKLWRKCYGCPVEESV